MKKLGKGAIWVVVAVTAAMVMQAQVKNPATASASATTAHGNDNPDQMSRDELFRTIKKLNAELFDAYNRCELEKFGAVNWRATFIRSLRDRSSGTHYANRVANGNKQHSRSGKPLRHQKAT